MKDIVADAAMLSGNAFSDDFVDLSTIDFEDPELFSLDSDVTSDYPTKLVSKKDTLVVPILDRLPHLKAWSSHSSLSTLSTTPSPTQEAFSSTPIQWNDADLSTSAWHLHHPRLTREQCIY
jgi:hypothetical protein